MAINNHFMGKDIVILSIRGRQVLSLISKGLTGKQIASALSISIHTVNVIGRRY